jgi:hypothetical protein
MQLILTIPGLLGLAIDVIVFLYFARTLPFGALSLPCVTVMTTLIYFYLMPVTAALFGDDYLFGMQLTTLEDTHWVALLYILGAAAACLLNERRLRISPTSRGENLRPLNRLALRALWVAASVAVLALVALGQLKLVANTNYQFTTSPLAFLNLGFTLAQPLMLIYLMRNNFGIKSLGLLAAVLYVYSVAGFRFRVVILLIAVASTFAVVRGIRIKTWPVVTAMLGGIILMNVFGVARNYGSGLDWDAIGSTSISQAFSQFGGEIALVYVMQYAAANPPDWVWFEPYPVALLRLVPAFLWPDKPAVDYLTLFASGFLDQRAAAESGTSAPQHVEMIYQFGWYGVPILAFIYFSIICRLQSAVSRLGRETRIAGMALIPPFFGYYMQSRGYFPQMIDEALFCFAPLFLLHIGKARSTAPARNVRPISIARN